MSKSRIQIALKTLRDIRNRLVNYGKKDIVIDNLIKKIDESLNEIKKIDGSNGVLDYKNRLYSVSNDKSIKIDIGGFLHEQTKLDLTEIIEIKTRE